MSFICLIIRVIFNLGYDCKWKWIDWLVLGYWAIGNMVIVRFPILKEKFGISLLCTCNKLESPCILELGHFHFGGLKALKFKTKECSAILFGSQPSNEKEKFWRLSLEKKSTKKPCGLKALNLHMFKTLFSFLLFTSENKNMVTFTCNHHLNSK